LVRVLFVLDQISEKRGEQARLARAKRESALPLEYLVIDVMMSGKLYERVRSKYNDEEWELA